MNNMPKNPKQGMKDRSIAFYVILAAALVIFIQTFTLLSPILLSFILIMLITLSVNPAVSWMRSLTGSRKGATALVTTTMIVGVVLTGWAFVGTMKKSYINLSKELPVYWERLQKPLIKIEQKALLSEEKLQAEVTTEIKKAETAAGRPQPDVRTTEPDPPISPDESGSIRTRLSEMLHGLIGSFTAMAFNGAQMLVVLVTVFFGVIFTLMDPRPIIRRIFLIVPERHHDQTLIIMQRIGKFVPAWAGATLIGMVAIGLLVILFMWPIFEFKDALLLGLIAGVMAAVPFLGPVLSAVPALLLALGIGGMTPLWVLLAYIVVQALEGNVIQPLVMARGIKLHPIALIFSMLLCVAAFGVLGVLVAAPLAAIADILHDELYRKRFLPTVTDADLDDLARKALNEKHTVTK
jgi:predicted PurR-regulated permease PerM